MEEVLPPQTQEGAGFEPTRVRQFTVFMENRVGRLQQLVRSYEEAAVSGVEFVSPGAIWDGHEPCGADGQYTNSVKPYLNFPNPVNGGSFHPNGAGQQTLAALTACYLDANRQPPDPFVPGQPPAHTIPDRMVTPAQLHMVPAPGLSSVPGSGEIPFCRG